MLDIDKIRQLVDMMVTNDLVEIALRDGDVEVKMRRPNAAAGDGAAIVTMPAKVAPVAGESEPSPEEETEELAEIKSPMVGTFYAASDPETPSFVQVGTPVHADTVVCIVEAMKVFNEIKAEVDGTIERILVKNGQSIEYGQPLFQVRTA